MKEKPIAFLSLIKLLEDAVGVRMRYALLDPFPCQTMRDGRPAIVAIQNVGKIIAQHIGLVDYVFVITVTNQEPNTAGHIELDHSGRDVFVELSPHVCECKDAVLAVLCHELSHKFLHKHGIKIGATVLEQEFLTDVTAVYLGLGKIMLNGCECQTSRQRTRDGTISTETHVLKTGYISRDCFAFVYRLVCAMRDIPRHVFLSGLSAAAREALQASESKYGNWFMPEFGTADGAAMLADSLKGVVESCQDDAAARHRILRNIDERLAFVRTRINQSHRPLQEAQQQIAGLAEPQPNPHLLFLNCLQTREATAGLLCLRDLQIKDILQEWKQVEAMASWRHETGCESSDDIVECPLDGRKLRVPMGRKRLLVTCPSCKYKFLVNTGPDAGTADVQGLPGKLNWRSRVIVRSAACLALALLFMGYVAGRRRIQSDSAVVHHAVALQKTDPWAIVSVEDDPEAKNALPPPTREQIQQRQHAAPSKAEDKSLVELTAGDFELDQPPTAPIRSLPTGTRLIEDQATTGHGELEIINGTRYDASLVVMDASTRLQVRKVYIKAQDSLTLGRLGGGDYSVFFQTGEDWDNSTEDFNRHASYYEFGKNLAFKETSDSEAIHYEHHSITLHPVPSGNVHSTSLSKSQFHALVGRM
jgi:hypothetical protein